MPANFRDELGSRTSDTSQPDMESKIPVVHADEPILHSASSAASSDSESNGSVAFDKEHTETSATNAAESDAKSNNSSTSEVEKVGLSVIQEADQDNVSKITISFDDDGSSTTTSEDSDEDNNDDTSPSQWDRPPPYEEEDQPKKPPAFEADPVRYILGMKLPIAESGFCACSHLTSTYATVFYILCYAFMLIIDSCTYITPIVRMCYAYKFQLFFTKEQQFVLHFWTGILLTISAFVLWIGTLCRSRATLMVWLLVMLAYVVMSTVVWLLGLLLSFAANGWNTHSTTAISAGFIDIGLEYYLLHMVYSYNRYMHDKAPEIHIYDPERAALRQIELERHGLREVNILGIPIVTRIAPPEETSDRQRQQVTSV